MTTYYYAFLLPTFIEMCDFCDSLSKSAIEPEKYIKLNKRYKEVYYPKDPQSPYYDKYIPYYENATIIEAEGGKLITVSYMIEDFFDDGEIITIHDELGMCELQEIKDTESQLDWIKIETEDFLQIRNNKINQVLNINLSEDLPSFEDLFN